MSTSVDSQKRQRVKGGSKKAVEKRRKTGNKAESVPKEKRTRNKNSSDPDSLEPAAAEAELDDMFADLKKQKAEKKKQEEVLAKPKKTKLQDKEPRSSPKRKGGASSPDARPAWFDEDGLPIYSAEALRVGQGGGTPDCPFDCDCCF